MSTVSSARSEAAHSSSGSFFSSIAMSFNSLASKTSPHSWHSTYSDSSSRETICTRGCLHCSGLTFFGGDCDGWLDIINLPTIHLLRGNVRFAPIWRYFAAAGSWMSSTHGAYFPTALMASRWATPPEYRLTGPRPFVKVPTLKLRGRPQLAKVKPLP
jgi:hypothetical protein